MFGFWSACATPAVACLSYGVVRWLISLIGLTGCICLPDGIRMSHLAVEWNELVPAGYMCGVSWYHLEEKWENLVQLGFIWQPTGSNCMAFQAPAALVRCAQEKSRIYTEGGAGKEHALPFVYNWSRQRRICFEAFDGTGVPTVPLRSLINGNSDEYWKPTTIESIGGWLKEYGDVFGFFIGDTPFMAVKDLDMIDEIFVKDLKNFTERGGMPSLLDAQRQFLEVLGEHADSGSEVDIKTISERLTFDVVCKVAFGVDTAVQRNPEQPLFQVALATVPNFMTGFFYNLAQKLFHWSLFVRAFSYVINIIYSNPMLAVANKAVDVIEFRRQNPQVNLPDMAQNLLDNAFAKRNEVIKKMSTAKSFPKGTTTTTSDERAPLMAGNCMVIFLGGYDTTRLVFTYWFYVMGRHQDVQEKMRQEALDAFENEGDHLSMQTLMSLEYANQVINETLRMYPPIATVITRAAEEDFQCGEYLIRKGTSIIASPYHFHHDPQYWKDPEKFDPERFSPENKKLIHPIVFQPLGLGRRMCIGYRLALVEILSVSTEVLRPFRITLGSSQKLELELDTYVGLAVPKEEV